MIDECNLLGVGISSFGQRQILVLEEEVDHADHGIEVQVTRKGKGLIELLVQVGMRDHREDRDENVILVHWDRRHFDRGHRIGIGAEKVIEAEVVEEIDHNRIPPVEDEIVERYVVVGEMREGGPQVVELHRIVYLALDVKSVRGVCVIGISADQVEPAYVVAAEVDKLLLGNKDIRLALILAHQ